MENHANNMLTKGRTKWLIITPDNNSPSILLGLLNSLDVLQKEGILQYKLINYDKFMEELKWADCVVFLREMNYGAIEYLNQAKRAGKKTLYYVDDMLYQLPEFTPGYNYYSSEQVLKGLEYFVKNTDLLIGCSDWIVESYKMKYGCKGVSITPAITTPLVRVNTKKNNKITVGFAGCRDYKFLLEEIKEVFIELKKKYKDDIQFEFFGPDVSFLKEVRGLYLRMTTYKDYERLLLQRKWDIGMAYLGESEFFNNKFYNKYLEYGRLGICGIYSDVQLYRRIIQNEENGILVKNNVESWYNQLDLLINNEQLRKKIITTAQQHVLTTFSPANGANEIKLKLKEFI